MAKMRIQIPLVRDTNLSPLEREQGTLVIGSFRGNEVYLSVLGEDRELIVNLDDLRDALASVLNFRIEE